jgi:predicted phosphoribosyltransferase
VHGKSVHWKTAERVRKKRDELMCLAVGQFYQDFAQVGDDEVIAALE